MAESRNSGGSRVALALVLGVIVAAVNAVVLVRATTGDWTAVQALTQGTTEPLATALRALLASNAGSLGYLVASPLILSVVVALLGTGRQAPPAATVPEAAIEPAIKPGEEALRLLRLLQEDARFVDFIQEDIDGYDDAQVGAAARSIHAGCRKALDGRVRLQRILDTEEGDKITVDAGFDPARIRLTGNVGGTPPFSGTLQHGGWRADSVSLPESPGGFDATVIAPAEVEIA